MDRQKLSNYIYFCILLVLYLEIIKISSLKEQSRLKAHLYLTFPQISPLKDALTCIKSNHSSELFLKMTYEQRMSHSKWINKEISLFTPNDSKIDNHCFNNYCGPWIESIWMEMAKEDFHIFGPFIPLFIPWLLMWRNHQRNIYFAWRNKIISMLSKDFFYITLTQCDEGLEGRDEKNNILPDNIIVISAGGKGHIPILLFLSENNPNNFSISQNYKYDVMFAGKITHPLRKRMVNEYSKLLGDRFKYFNKKIDWKLEYDNSKFICAPRGLGRNSFRLTEILQTGRIPIYVYNDIIWLPYYDSINWNSFSIVTHIFDINKTVDRIKNTSQFEIENMRKRILSLYNSHFTIKAVFNQIKLFLRYGFVKSDLRCATYKPYK